MTRQRKPERSVVQPRKPDRTVVPPRKVRPEYRGNRDSYGGESKFQASFSNSYGNAETSNRKKHRPGCRLALKQRNERNGNETVLDGQSSQSLRSSLVCRRFKNSDDVTIFDPIARANARVRNSFAEQEYRELEALARSIFNQKISLDESGFQHGGLSPRSSCSSGNAGLRITSVPSGPQSDSEKSSNCNLESPKVHGVRSRKASRVCRKHFHESASSSVTSVRSRTDSVYLTASSRGRRRECKIHGRRCIKKNAKSTERRHHRDSQESDECNGEIVHRRRPRERAVNRHKSDFAILRFCK